MAVNLKTFGIYGAIAAGVYGYNLLTEAERDSTGAIVTEGRVDAFQMHVGDCFDDVASNGTGEEVEVSEIPGVPCSSPHDNEVYAIYDVGETSFPEGRMDEIAFDGCMERFETFVGKDYQESSLDIFTMYPTPESWKQRKDREVICAVYDMNLAKLTGSAKGRAL
jgi:Septum formation